MKQLAVLRKQGIYELPYEEDPDPDEMKKKKEEEKAAVAVSEASAAASGIDPTMLIANELRELKKLVDEGILTQEEFDERKKKLLNR